MHNTKAKMLILVEGSRIDIPLMEHLFRLYRIDADYEIVSYDTNIYTLYNQMFKDGTPEYMDILQALKEREPDRVKKSIFEQSYTDILLIFDLDPQDPQFTYKKISEMMDYFVESTDMGKLYINYPMVESFYHMQAIPDTGYNNRTVTLTELRNRTYKQRVHNENRNKDYLKFARTLEECTTVINQNIEKGWQILSAKPNETLPDNASILNKQLVMLNDHEKIHVLCTCVFFIFEYNPHLLQIHSLS
ncbi:MAG: hypothetical protein FWE90_02595 [Defluviitaleaceae bacterium]|nr:hypothetical protein [Defluviitaleaceae bacterium]